MPVIVSRVPGTWSRRPHGPDAAAPAMTEVLHLRWAEPVMAQPGMGHRGLLHHGMNRGG